MESNEYTYIKTIQAQKYLRLATKEELKIYNQLNGFDKNKNKKTIITRMWICPVTLFVLGRYPKHIYIKKKK